MDYQDLFNALFNDMKKLCDEYGPSQVVPVSEIRTALDNRDTEEEQMLEGMSKYYEQMKTAKANEE